MTPLASGLLARRFPDRVASGRPATAAARRRLVSQTKAALAADSRLGLNRAQPATAGCSPHHLSPRVTQLTGFTVSQYQNRRRVTNALLRSATASRTSPPSRLNSDSQITPT